MLDSIPVPMLAILWPIMGAVVITGLGRLAPAWLGRLVALAAATASLATLWSLRAREAALVGLSWEPLNSFRMSPALYPDHMALLVGSALAGLTAVASLGIQGSRPRRTAWHGLILIALAGGLIVTMAANLLTLAMGSALIDLAVMAMAISFGGEGNQDRQAAWPMSVVVPGVASTLVLFAGAVWMDVNVGTASLLSRAIPPEVLTAIGASSLLRMMVFPLHPRGVNQAEHAAICLLPVGTGIYLLARVQSLGPVLAGAAWMWSIGGAAVLVGGVMAWASSIRLKAVDPATSHAEPWLGIAVHQTGVALVLVIAWGADAPWPLISVLLALESLAIWWDSSVEGLASPRPAWLEGVRQTMALLTGQAAGATEALVQKGGARAKVGLWLKRVGARVRLWAARWASVREWWQSSWVVRRALAFVPGFALLSLAGAPLTAGAVTRWHLYGGLLRGGKAGLLIALLAADSLLVAALWATARTMLRQARRQRPRPAALLALTVVAVVLTAVGIAPRALAESLGLKSASIAGVSRLGVGLLYVFPWLVGSWLAHVTGRAEGGILDPVRRIVRMEWLYRGLAVGGRWLADSIYWVGSVGEGEGWWGWALVILAVGALFLTAS